jgi:hypothetical protein
MKINQFALVSGAVLLTLGGMTAVACSSSSTPTPVQGSQDSGAVQSNDSGGTVTPNNDGGTVTPTGDSGTVTPTGDSGSGSCAKPPALHVPVADGGVYCPYSFNDATDSGIQYCSGATPQCCVSPSSDAGPSDCEAVGACASSTSTVWQCSAPSDCAGTAGNVCCIISGPLEPDTACSGYQKTKGLDSITCMPAADCTGPIEAGAYLDTHYVACEQQSDCTTGTCTPVFTSGSPIGVCL